MSDWHSEDKLKTGQIIYLVDQGHGIIAVKVVEIRSKLNKRTEAFVQKKPSISDSVCLDDRVWAPTKEELLDFLSKNTREWKE